jgi:hypothetical protein
VSLSLKASDVVARTSVAVLEIGRGWMLAPETNAFGGRLGLQTDSIFDFWVNGRAGVLGDGDAAKAEAAIAFMGPHAIRDYWEGRPTSLSAMDAAIRYAQAAAEWGREALQTVPEPICHELAELTNRICASAQPSVGVLFAGWRQLPRPADARGAVTVALNVLRELRGGAHLSAVYAAGLTPLGAIMSVDHPQHGGPGRAARFGWNEPYPAPDYAARELAEDLTSTILTPIYDAALSPTEGARFVELVTTARAAIEA